MFNFRRGQEKHSEREARTDFNAAAYTRGVTLTGFKSEKTAQLERQRLQHLKSVQRRLTALFMVVVGLVLLGLALLAQYAGSVVRVQTDARLAATDQARYLKLINDYYQTNPLERFSFMRRNSVLLNYLRQQAPEVLSVDVVPAGLMLAQAKLSFRAPVAQWTANGKTNFVDDKGVVFQHNYYGAPQLTIEDNSGAKSINGVAAPAGFLSFVGQTATALVKRGISVRRVVVPKGAARYVELYVDSRQYPFKAQITRQPESEASDIATMVRYIDTHNIKPIYVDCRVAGKAFWK